MNDKDWRKWQRNYSFASLDETWRSTLLNGCIKDVESKEEKHKLRQRVIAIEACWVVATGPPQWRPRVRFITARPAVRHQPASSLCLCSVCVISVRGSIVVLAQFFVLNNLLNSLRMSDAAAAPAPAKVTKKRAGGAAKAKKPADHPKYSDMIKAAIAALKVCSSLLTFLCSFVVMARNAISVLERLELNSIIIIITSGISTLRCCVGSHLILHQTIGRRYRTVASDDSRQVP